MDVGNREKKSNNKYVNLDENFGKKQFYIEF